MSAVPIQKIEIEGWPLIPEGEYLATYRRYELAFLFKTAKCFVYFQIYGGEYAGTRLYRPYRVKEITRKTKRGGQFKLGTSHDCSASLPTSLVRGRGPTAFRYIGSRVV